MIIKTDGKTNESQGTARIQGDALGVLQQGLAPYASRSSAILNPTYPVYQLVVSINHNPDGRLYGGTPPTLISDIYRTGTTTPELKTNIVPWNAGGLYYSAAAGSAFFRRTSVVSTEYISFVWTIRWLGAGDATFNDLPNGNISWKLVNSKSSELSSGYGGGPGSSGVYRYIDLIYYNSNGDCTDNLGNIQPSLTVYSTTAEYNGTEYTLEPNLISRDWY